ncbi:MAG: GNAT family N-acetyltransferase [Bdellovibrionales bacterium]|jgi:predicted N-acetyltransferase YhbS|nr:GNAT family N-acetyltransferase [Bdellovibrionales bacterium]
MDRKNNLIISNLKESPEYRNETLKLIEKSLGYSNGNSFMIDFYPLMKEANAENNFILIKDNKVSAHIGISYRYLTLKGIKSPVALLGGICSSKEIRGKGIFSDFLKTLISQNEEKVAYFILWSNLSDFYERFNFFEAGKSIQTKPPGPLSSEILKSYQKIKYADLTPHQWTEIKDLYNHKNEVIKFDRSDEDWETLSKIESSELYIKEAQSKIVSYFIKDKGQDLENLIHEYGIDPSEEKNLLPLLKRQSIWLEDRGADDLGQVIFSAFFRVGSRRLLDDFLSKVTDRKLRLISSCPQVTFTYKNETFECDTKTFLQVIHGPFEMKSKVPYLPVYFCGLDSV